MPKKTQDLSSDFEEYRKALAGEIGERIRQRRLAVGLRQEDLRAKLELERVFVSRTHYSRMERGEYLPDAALIIALAQILEVSPNWLLTGHG